MGIEDRIILCWVASVHGSVISPVTQFKLEKFHRSSFQGETNK